MAASIAEVTLLEPMNTRRGSAAHNKFCRYESTMGSRCSCSAYAPLLHRLRLQCETGITHVYN